jgi:hypothetical protein
LRRILPLVDAIEVFNARCIVRNANQLAREFAASQNKPGSAGSDAHSYREIGRTRMLLPSFHDGPSLSLAFAQAELVCRASSLAIHFVSSYATWRKKRGWRPPHAA